MNKLELAAIDYANENYNEDIDQAFSVSKDGFISGAKFYKEECEQALHEARVALSMMRNIIENKRMLPEIGIMCDQAIRDIDNRVKGLK